MKKCLLTLLIFIMVIVPGIKAMPQAAEDQPGESESATEPPTTSNPLEPSGLTPEQREIFGETLKEMREIAEDPDAFIQREREKTRREMDTAIEQAARQNAERQKEYETNQRIRLAFLAFCIVMFIITTRKYLRKRKAEKAKLQEEKYGRQGKPIK